MAWIKNPYERPLKYFILLSRSPGEFEGMLKKYQIDFLFDTGEARTCYDLIKKTMPEELFFWHDKGDDRDQYPPAKAVGEWVDKNNISKFYYNLFLKSGELDKVFLDAWNFFSLRMIAKICESMKIGEFDLEDIYGIADSLKAHVTPAGLDMFFSEFFDLSNMDSYEISNYITRLETHAVSNSHFLRDSQGKRHAFLNPRDFSLTSFYNFGVLISDQDMLATMKQAAYMKYMGEANALDYDRGEGPDRMTKLASIVVASMREGRDSGITKTTDVKKSSISLTGSKAKFLEAKTLKEQKQLASRSVPEAEIVEDDEKDGEN